MDLGHITAPFGRRPLSLASVAAQVAAREVDGKAAHKWRTFGAIAEAKLELGVSDRTLSVLNALLTFIPETALSPGQLVVFASNRALALRAHGMAETTLRRHLNALVEAGLVIRRDSPNGKRYARKDDDGVVEAAFGFDLSPILARAGEFDALAARVASDRRAAALARERVTILRRDVSKMIQAGGCLGAPAVWAAHRAAFAALCWRLPRIAAPDVVLPLVAQLDALSLAVGKSLEYLLEARNQDGTDSHGEVHHQKSKPENTIEVEPGSQKSGGIADGRNLPIGLVLKACPDIAMYDRGEVRTWRDLLGSAAVVRGILGISQSAWDDARETMGDHVAAATVAGILQRGDAIRSPGAYLRGLTERSRQGRFSVWPMMLALLRGSDRSASLSPAVATSPPEHTRALPATGPGSLAWPQPQGPTPRRTHLGAPEFAGRGARLPWETCGAPTRGGGPLGRRPTRDDDV